MSFHIPVEAGSRVILPTAGRYCDRDILISGNGYTDADLQAKYEEGCAHSAQLCTEKHFVQTFEGDGGTSVTVHVPFRPDTLQLFCYNPLALYTAGAATHFTYNCSAFGVLVGFVQYGKGTGTLGNAALAASAIAGRCTISADGTVRFFNLGGSSATVTFPTNFSYTVVAVKYVDRTDAQRIQDFVDSLTGSGSVTLQQAKVTAAFTDEEWASLIAAKPNWTFNWI